MICGYGYQRTEQELRAIGAEIVWIDWTRERTERAAMMKPGALRDGYTLRLLAENDLAGNSRANAKWRRMLAERGVTVEIVTVEAPRKKVGPKPKFDPSPDQDSEIAPLFGCDHYTAAYKVRRACEIMGHAVTYAQLYHRYVTKRTK